MRIFSACTCVCASEKPNGLYCLLSRDILYNGCNIICGYLFARERISANKFPRPQKSYWAFRAACRHPHSCLAKWCDYMNAGLALIPSRRNPITGLDGQNESKLTLDHIAQRQTRPKTSFLLFCYRLCFPWLVCCCAFGFKRVRESARSAG